VRLALRVSTASLVWTLVAGLASCAIGTAANSLVLISFGAIGLVDAAGSAALVVHFRHTLRHERTSEAHERAALRVVTAGMSVIGLLTTVESVHRLVAGVGGEAIPAGAVLAGVSVLVLATLAVIKRRLARVVKSQALLADGWLSAMGSLLALVTVFGAALSAAFGRAWLDAAAAAVVGCVAMALSFALRRGALHPPEGPGHLTAIEGTGR
jgi:divalent metal cation (Fe/Co/Zn/Cd) transporter